MKRIGQVLPQAVTQEEALRRAKAQTILRDWKEIVGEGLASRSHPDRYGRGTVWVAVEGSAWAQELRLRKEMILTRLRQRGRDVSLFEDIRFGVRPLPAPGADLEPAPEEPKEPLARDTEMTIREIAERRRARWALATPDDLG